jgi:hypothetical protein
MRLLQIITAFVVAFAWLSATAEAKDAKASGGSRPAKPTQIADDKKPTPPKTEPKHDAIIDFVQKQGTINPQIMK